MPLVDSESFSNVGNRDDGGGAVGQGCDHRAGGAQHVKHHAGDPRKVALREPLEIRGREHELALLQLGVGALLVTFAFVALHGLSAYAPGVVVGAKAMHARTGKVWLVGAGPGDPGLLTRRGAAAMPFSRT